MNFKILLSFGFTVATLGAVAQNSNRTYAITGDGNKDYIWMNIRQVDLGTGVVNKTIFQRSESAYSLTDVNTKKTINQSTQAELNIFTATEYPTATFVAAAALDARSNKLFFIPMRMGELRWLDLESKEPKFYTMTTSLLKVGDIRDESNHVTRMVIAADGNGYAVTNDGNHLFRFTTGKKPELVDLGNLIDAEENKTVSIHNKCTSWGGDMIADAFGKLYIISANRQVFAVDISSRIATFKGTISGLPANYTTNGAAVDADGNIVVSSANVFEGYYRLKLDDLAATRIEGSDVVYNASDLANGNLLLQKEADAARKFADAPSVTKINLASSSKIFPNPITNSSFRVLFDGYDEGNYTVVLSDLAGRSLQSTKLNVNKGVQSREVRVNGNPAKGMYMVKVLNEQKQIVFTEKVMIQ